MCFLVCKDELSERGSWQILVGFVWDGMTLAAMSSLLLKNKTKSLCPEADLPVPGCILR